VLSLPSDYELHINFSSLLTAVRMLAHVTKKYPERAQDRQLLKSISRDIEVLLA